MQYTTLITLALALVGADARIGFTSNPGAGLEAGQPFQITWDGADAGSPVTITLKQGDPDNLQTVALITGNGMNGEYSWTPSTSIPNGDNYALEISQGTGYDETNYSGEFSISGGSASSSSSSSGSTSSASSSSGASGAGGVLVTITSGSSTYTTTEAAGMMTGTGTMSMSMGNATTSSRGNSTLMHTSRTPTGGIQATRTVTPTSSQASASSSPTSSANAAPLVGSMGGLAGFLLGAVALL